MPRPLPALLLATVILFQRHDAACLKPALIPSLPNEAAQEKEIPSQRTADRADGRSLEIEISFGKEYAAWIRNVVKLNTDPNVNEYVTHLGERLASGCDAGFPFTFMVRASDDVDAIVLPGGFFFINSGLITAAEEEDSLAAILAHLIAHSCAHHPFRSIPERIKQTWQPGMIIIHPSRAQFCTGLCGMDSPFPLPSYLTAFSPAFEREADDLALGLLDRAGYDPRGLEIFSSNLSRTPGSAAASFVTHIQDSSRRKRTIRMARKLRMPSPYMVTSSTFEQVKNRLAMISHSRAMR
jgi:predicted Zn-dependent protease